MTHNLFEVRIVSYNLIKVDITNENGFKKSRGKIALFSKTENYFC